jgi:predicted transcriptional regulator of viral defense system
MLPSELDDAMRAAHLRRPKMIFSHDSALPLYGLADRHPISHMEALLRTARPFNEQVGGAFNAREHSQQLYVQPGMVS